VGCSSTNDNDCATPIPALPSAGWPLLAVFLSLTMVWTLRRWRAAR
jgi:hypothetical protein